MKNLIFYIIPVILLVGCRKAPETAFTPDKTIVEVNEEIKFDNKTDGGTTYIWDFGDGNYSDSRSPIKSYSATGIYEVTLTAFSKHKRKEASAKESIHVSERYIDRVEVISIPFTKPDGSAWDPDGSGPDLRFFMNKSNNNSQIWYGSAEGNIMPSDLPVVWYDFTTNSNDVNMIFTNEFWKFELMDMTPGGPEDIMVSFVLNPKIQNNPIQYQSGDYHINIYWKLK